MDDLTKRISELAEERGLNKTFNELGLSINLQNNFGIRTPYQLYGTFYSLNKKFSEKEAKETLSKAMKMSKEDFSILFEKVIIKVGKEFIELYKKLLKKEYPCGL